MPKSSPARISENIGKLTGDALSLFTFRPSHTGEVPEPTVHANPLTMRHKRRRLILSCVSCRRRKLGCDRGDPCVRCQRAGHPETCTYDTPGVSGSNCSGQSTRLASPHHDEIEQPSQVFLDQVTEMESYVKSAGAQPIYSEKYLGLTHPDGPGASRQSRELQPFEQPLQPSQTVNTQYFGPSNVTGLLLQCEKLSTFVRKALLHVPSSSQWRGQSRVEVPAKKRVRFGELPSKERLISFIPPRARADRLIQMYVNVFENTYRVLHVPTFLQRYRDFWALPNFTPDSTIVHILLAMSAVNAFVPGGEGDFIGRSSAARVTAKLWIREAESWLSAQTMKNYTLDTLQTHVLLFHAKKMNCMERKRRWASIGTLLRSIMAAGLHREPTCLIQNMSFFDAELRRRLWYTVMELELQEACDRGVQPMFNGDTWDCSPPLNVYDEDFDEATTSAPCERPLDSYTRTSFLCTAGKHLLLRLDVLNEINSVRKPMGIDTARKYVALLKASIDRLPRWSEESSSAVPMILSRLILYEQLLILQQPFAAQASSYQGSLCFDTVQRQAAIFIMESYRTLPQHEGLQLFNFRGDGFRAILIMCYEALYASNHVHHLLHNKEAEIVLIEHTVKLLDDRVRRLGQGFQFYWLASAALHLITARYSESPDEDLLAMKTAESACRVLNYMNQQKVLDEGRMFRDLGFSNRYIAGFQKKCNQPRTFLTDWTV